MLNRNSNLSNANLYRGLSHPNKHGINKNPKPIFMSMNPDRNELQSMIELIREYMDDFARNYEDMPGLGQEIA